MREVEPWTRGWAWCSALSAGLSLRLGRCRNRAGLEIDHPCHEPSDAVLVKVDHGVMLVALENGAGAVLVLRNALTRGIFRHSRTPSIHRFVPQSFSAKTW